mmetsp:Transcript_2508/g.6452  ORF Transcript_2508/g.6452 Transcript_2508/m.6452 type:complete len:91 (+) Transcript_2508:340-612(+)
MNHQVQRSALVPSRRGVPGQEAAAAEMLQQHHAQPVTPSPHMLAAADPAHSCTCPSCCAARAAQRAGSTGVHSVGAYAWEDDEAPGAVGC